MLEDRNYTMIFLWEIYSIFYANIFYCFSPPTWPPCTHLLNAVYVLVSILSSSFFTLQHIKENKPGLVLPDTVCRFRPCIYFITILRFIDSKSFVNILAKISNAFVFQLMPTLEHLEDKW